MREDVIIYNKEQCSNFIEYLNAATPWVLEQPFRNKEHGVRIMPWFVKSSFSTYAVSVQCGYLLYCSPALLVPFNRYTQFEIAIMDKGEISRRPEDILRGFSKKNEIMYHFSTGVFKFVPKDLVQEVIDFICR